jgi:hypothetical protein
MNVALRARHTVICARSRYTAALMLLRFAVLLVSLGWVVTAVRASDVDLVWRAPDQGCPDRAQLVEGLSQRLRRPVSTGSDAQVHVRADVAHPEAGYLLSLHMESKQGTEQRSLRAAECNELAQATVLIAALFITDSGEPTAGLPLTAAEVDGSLHPQWYVRAQLVGDIGTFPAANLGPGIMVGVALGDVRIELGGTHVFSQELRVAGSAAPVGRLQLTTAAAAVCYGVTRRPFVAPCLIGELGRLAASGDNVAQAQDRALVWAMAGASARASFELLRWLRGQAEIAGGLPWDHAEFGVQELGRAHRVANVVARLSLGVEGVF